MGVESLLPSDSRESAEPGMRLREACPREREPRIQLDGVLISGHSFAHALFGVAISIKATLQIILMSFDVFGSAFFRSLHLCLNRRFRLRTLRTIRELTAQLPDDGLSELGLHGEH